MDTRFDKKIKNGVFEISLYCTNFSYQEILTMTTFGDVRVDMGGEFPDPPVSSTPLATPATPFAPVYARTHDHQLLRTNMSDPSNPYVIWFDGNRLGMDVAEEYAKIWVDTIEGRIRNGMLALRADNDDFSGNTTYTV